MAEKWMLCDPTYRYSFFCTLCFALLGAGKRRKNVLPDVDGTKYLPWWLSWLVFKQTGAVSSREFWLSVLLYYMAVMVVSGLTRMSSSGGCLGMGF